MKLSEWRPSLRSWLKSQLPVTTELIDRPDRVGHTNLVIEPIHDITLREVDPATAIATGYQDVIYSVRLSGDLPFRDLQVEVWEGLYLSMMLKLTKRWQSIHAGLMDLTIDSDSNVSTTQISLTEASDGDGDWLLDLTWSLRLEWEAELEDEPMFNGLITQFNLYLWRSDLENFDNRTLDHSMTFPDSPI